MSCWDSFIDCICCVNKPKHPSPYNFTFNGNDLTAQNKALFESNFVRTSKYTLLTFLPMGLFYQFKRLANVYFLMIAVLQSIPQISPLNVYTAWVPLIIVLSISMLREGYEDYQRYKSDKLMNYEYKTQVRRNGKFVQVEWSEVNVGDICKVVQEGLFPADLILLTSSSHDGVSYIETASLDGQKNLKPKNAYPETQLYSSEAQLAKLTGVATADPPQMDTKKFKVDLTIGGKTIVYNGTPQLLYRGTFLKNTKWIYGLAVYTGRNTKIMLNSQGPTDKMSQIQIKVNFILIFIFIIQVILCFIMAVFYGVFRNQVKDTHTYILWNERHVVGDSILIFLTYIVLINTMIPISLVVSIEIVKFSQSYFINNDRLMYSSYRKKFVNVKSASLNQELGQIEYIFSDKTGTLTKNIMEFKIALIGSTMYGDTNLISQNNKNQIITKGFKDETLTGLLNNDINDQNLIPNILLKDKSQTKQIAFKTKRQLADEYFKILSIAHDVVVDPEKNIYQAESPDEVALVNSAKLMGYQFIKSTQSTKIVKIKGVQKSFQVLQLFPFESEMKRMTIVVRQNGIIKMYMKGADSKVIQTLAKGKQVINLDRELNSFSRVGLRTLLIAGKIVTQKEYQQYRKKLQSLPIKNKDKQFKELRKSFEEGLYLLGGTAVLDRLQDDVPETIRDMLRANVKVWMLTGDKLQTAENIAKSCNLIQQHFQIIRYHNQDSPHLSQQDYITSLAIKVRELTQRGIPKAFLFQETDIKIILQDTRMIEQFAQLAKNCQAVVGCRLQPSDKAQVVTIVRKYLNKITLAIGDGSNDVTMIKAAHIGVGLYGQEGMGAVQASDYALPQFRMLWRLLLVHGRWNYIRISEMILYFFYKNMLFTLPQFILGFYSGYSGQTMFDDYYITLYNLAFTSLPLIIRAIFQQDVNYVYRDDQTNDMQHTETKFLGSVTLQKQNSYLPKEFKINKYFYRLFPKIYFIGQQNCVFNYFNYSMWVLEGILESILISFFTIYIIGNLSLNQKGYNSDWWIVGLTIFSAVILVVTIKLATHTKFWSIVLLLIMAGSLGIYAAYTWLSNYYLSDNINGTAYMGWTSGQTYLLVLFCVCLILTIDGVVVSLDYDRGGYASKMREVIRAEQLDNLMYFDEISLKISQNLSAVPGRK